MPYSLLVTSCQRDDLLETTIGSFVEHCDQPPSETIIVDDGPNRPMPDFLRRQQNVRWLCNGARAGQIASCDRLWQECATDYAMWCEEDWRFVRGGFVEKSFEIIDKFSKVISVSLHGPEGCVDDERFPFKVAPLFRGWGGFTFNPGLRRKVDWVSIGGYAHAIPDPRLYGYELKL